MQLCIVQNIPYNINSLKSSNKCPYCRKIYFENRDIIGMELPARARNIDEGRCPYAGISNMILAFRASDIFFKSHKMALSVKCAFNGEEVYEINGRRIAVDDNSYLILNEGQEYASYIESKREVESFCIFFSQSFISDMFRNFTLSADKMLEEPLDPVNSPVNFFETLHHFDDIIAPVIGELRKKVMDLNFTHEWLAEIFYNLAEKMFSLHQNIKYRIEEIPALKKDTRTEIFERVNIAKDFMLSSLEKQIKIEDIAGVAGLSPYHFLRLFKQVFRETPRRYLMSKRLEKAKQLLLNTDMTITDITLEVGFESVNYFSRLFKKTFGTSPTEFREINRKKFTSLPV